MDQVKRFWDDQAKEFGESDLATAPDHYYREMEIERIEAHLRDGDTILDVGCGNGYSTLRFAQKFPNCRIVGIDYSDPMIEAANTVLAKSGLGERVSFLVGDVRSLTDHPLLHGKTFTAVVSERCIINLANWDEQRTALLQMRALLEPDGRIILTENTQEGLARLNGLRKQFGLHEISVRWHNFYVPQQKFEDFAAEHFTVEAKQNIGNLYYLMSRVLYAKLAADEGQEPRYEHPINRIAAQLPSLDQYEFSPNYIYVLRHPAGRELERAFSDAARQKYQKEIDAFTVKPDE